MKVYFRVENTEFVDYLKLTANGKSYYFCDELTVEVDDYEILDVEIELVRAEDYMKLKSQNPFIRLLQNIAGWIISPFVFFADNDGGIHLDNGYKTFSPFTYKKSFSITPQNGEVVYVNYTKAEYDEVTKKYTKPSLQIKGDGVIDKNEESSFASTILKQEWNIYHIPAFSVLMLIVLLLNVLSFSLFAKVIREIPIYSMCENIGGIIGVSLSSLFMVALLVAYIVIIVKAYRVQKEVIDANK